MYTYKAKCARVVDGDTVDLEVDLGFGIFFKERFRLAGINTPETYGVKKESTEYQAGIKSKNRLKELIEGKELIVTTKKDKKGKYGRYIATIFVAIDSSHLVQDVGDILVAEGLAERKFY